MPKISKQMREVVSALESSGYALRRHRGSHYIYSNGEDTVVINKNLNKMVGKRLIKEHNLYI